MPCLLYTSINAELEQVRQKLDRARKLSAVMEDLKAQHEERKRGAEDALKVLYREQEDVEELERLSFASFLARIRGEQAERLDQERREAVAAKARYDAARRDLADLEARFQAAQKERAGLAGLRGRCCLLYTSTAHRTPAPSCSAAPFRSSPPDSPGRSPPPGWTCPRTG